MHDDSRRPRARRSAIILRRHLPDKAKDVHYIRVFFGTGKKADSVVIQLP